MLTLLQQKRYWSFLGHDDPKHNDNGCHPDLHATRDMDICFVLSKSYVSSFKVLETNDILPLTPPRGKGVWVIPWSL